MRCNIYGFLYRLVPLPLWQSLIMRIHLSRCPQCSESLDFTTEDGITTVGMDAASAAAMEPHLQLWNRVEDDLLALENSGKRKKNVPLTHGWFSTTPGTWTLAAAGTMLLVLVFLFPWSYKQPQKPAIPDGEYTNTHLTNQKADPAVVSENKPIIINSLMVDNQPAKAIRFQPGNKNRLIIWVKKQ